MRKLERQTSIMERMAREATLEVVQLAREFDVSGETIRRDLSELEARGLVRKVHGAAVLPQALSDSSYQSRMKTNADGKNRIGRAVAGLVDNGDSLLIGTGTTATFVAQALRNHHDLTVVTNSVDVARILAFGKRNQIFMAGGQLSAEDGAALSQTAIEYVRQFRFKYAVFSAGGFDLEDGLTDFKAQEAEFTRAVIQRAETVILALDSSKFGRRAHARVVDLAGIDVLVTNSEPAEPYLRRLEEADVKVVVG